MRGIEVTSPFGRVAVDHNVASAHLAVRWLKPVKTQREAVYADIAFSPKCRAQRGSQAFFDIAEEAGIAVIVGIRANAMGHANGGIEPFARAQVDAIQTRVAAMFGKVNDNNHRWSDSTPRCAEMSAIFGERT